jgi:hypothetical protein
MNAHPSDVVVFIFGVVRRKLPVEKAKARDFSRAFVFLINGS